VVKHKIDGIIGVAPLNLKYFKSFKGEKAVIPNGIDLERFNPNNQKIEKFKDQRINILFLGRIEQRKGLIYLLKAFKILTEKFSNLRLIVVGGGELKKECQDWVRDNGLNNVCFEGKVKDEKVPGYYAVSDIFVSPAIFGESFGLVLLEAMASGVPVVAFANQGYKGLLKDKRGAFLVPPKDYVGLAKKLEILVNDKGLRKTMGEKGIQEAEQYAWSKVCDQVLDFYQLCQKTKNKG